MSYIKRDKVTCYTKPTSIVISLIILCIIQSDVILQKEACKFNEEP